MSRSAWGLHQMRLFQMIFPRSGTFSACQAVLVPLGEAAEGVILKRVSIIVIQSPAEQKVFWSLSFSSFTFCPR